MSKGVVKTWEEEEKYGPLVDHKEQQGNCYLCNV